VQEKESDLDEETRIMLNGLDKVVEHLTIELRELQLENTALKTELAKLKEKNKL
jgi:hypothetical protein